ncbi:V-type ATP synthase subunit I [Desulfogranum mediterraneum]|uniref:V-type ATP synthase subunit I n=1 Tax=Desulfogranum mediterraneum TaxID=160661 RepID=UPI000407DBEE|nr:V-type ATPase 116kDa subunit family protein [Desulfogranum mediterraneum]
MFRPVQLTRVTIQIPEEYISVVMAILGDLRLLHLIRVEETPLGRMGYVAHVNIPLLERYDALLIRVNGLLEELQVSGAAPLLGRAQQPDKLIFRLEEECAGVEQQALDILREKKNLHTTLGKDQDLIDRLRLLEPLGLELGRLAALRYTVFQVGLIPEESLERLETSLGEIHHSLIPIERKQGRIVLFAMALKEDEAVLLRALKSAFWDPLALSTELQGKVPAILEQLTEEREKTAAELTELEKRAEALARQYGGVLLQLREQLLVARQLILAQQKFGQLDHTYLLTGWLPLALFEELRQRIMAASADKAIVEQLAPEEVKEVRSGILTIPILFNNPALIRPFERLTILYATPSYEEVEPTAFLAITFLLLFGLMFGDVGHGGLLAVLGYLIFKKMYRYLDYGIILMECGLSALLFGILYGSVFGLEDLIPALWMHPMENIGYFMKVSVVIGITMISVGLILNLVNILRQHRYAELLSSSGLAGALFYWLLCALSIRYLLIGPPSAGEILFAKAAGGLLFVLMIFQHPVRQLLARSRQKREGRFSISGVGVSFLESIVDVLDELLRYLANTASFVRIAAFALAHAGLFMAVFTLADMVRHAQGSGFLYWLSLVLGNVVIIGLEGLVVSIQTVRLEYYEFFSKFFRGGGKPFQPLL